MLSQEVAIIGYSGHAYVICDIFLSQKTQVIGYFDQEEKSKNPYDISYLGREKTEAGIEYLKEHNYFVGIGDNSIRARIIKSIYERIQKMPVNALHKNASISSTAILGKGVMIGDGVIVNACADIGDGVICNTQSVVEHECKIGNYSHIAPGAVLCGNVVVGKNTFVGARSVVKQGVRIGDNVTVGAGAVVIRDIPDNSKIVGNPQKFI